MTPQVDPATFYARFWGRVVRRKCWLYQGPLLPNGYGSMNYPIQLHPRHGRRGYAHRLAWELAHGPIPAGLSVLHRCDVRNCVNPSHLFLGTHTDNMRDCKAKGRNRAVNAMRPGAENPKAKLTVEQVVRIRTDYREGIRSGLLAERYGVSQSSILRLVKQKTWRCVA